MGVITEIALFLAMTFVIMSAAPTKTKIEPMGEPAARVFNADALMTTPTELNRLENGIFMTKSTWAGVIGAYWRIIVILRDPMATITNKMTLRDIAQ